MVFALAHTWASELLSADVTNGLVSRWKFDEASGSASDSVGTNTGTLVGDVSRVTGKVGTKAAEFSGGTAYIDVGNGSSLNLSTGDFTISGWINASNLGASNREIPLITKTSDYHNDDGFGIEIHTYGGSATSYAFAIYLSAQSPGDTSFGSVGYLSVDAWHHWTLVRSGTTLKWYINGVLDATGTNASYGLSISGNDSMAFGKRGWHAFDFAGKMDDIRVYNRALGDSEVGAMYAYGNGDTIEPTVAVTSPSSGATVSGTNVPVAADASDNTGVVGVQFKLDGVNLGAEDTTSPYSITWDTTTASNGSHTITAVTHDAAGNTSTSAGVQVTVSGGGDITSGLVGWWKFDEASGSASDSVGTNTGTLVGGVLRVTGKVGAKAAAFSGGTAYIDVGNASSLNLGTGDFTMSGWINASNLGASNREIPLITKTSDYHNDDGFGIEIHTYGGSATSFAFAIYLSAQSPGDTSFGTVGYLSVDAWHHWALVRSGTTLKWYINGVLDATGTNASYGLSISGNDSMAFGKRGWHAFDFAGKMDDIRVYNRALSDSEVGAVYAYGSSDAPPTAPTAINYAEKTATTVTLIWQASVDDMGVVGYNIYRGGALIGSTFDLVYSDSGLQSNTSYSYTAKAIDTAGNLSASSGAFNVTTTQDFSADSDHDGISDVTEAALGTNNGSAAAADTSNQTQQIIHRPVK